MASVVGEKEIDLTKLNIQQLSSLKGELEQVSGCCLVCERGRPWEILKSFVAVIRDARTGG